MEKNSQGYRLIFGYLGSFLIMIGLIILIPLIVVIFEPQEITLIKYFIFPSIGAIIVGLLLRLLNYKRSLSRLKRHEDVVLLIFIWLSAILISALPIYLTGEYRYAEAVFEMTSGYTTTGMTVFQVSGASKIFLLYRSLTHYIGGVGLVLVLTSTISDKFGIQLFTAEGHTDRLLPNLVKSARFIFSIYTIYILIGMILYVFSGMTLFDALNHSISAVSTGGFSTKVNSIAHYNSVSIEIITIVLMLLGSTNFMIHLFLFRRQFKKVVGHIELKFLAIYGLVMIGLLSLTSGITSFGSSLRVGVFQFVSAMSSTGLVNYFKPFSSHKSIYILLITLIMVIGGGLGSTAGGVKLYRMALFSKGIYWQTKSQFSNPKIIRVQQINYLGKKEVVNSKILSANYLFLGLYSLILFLGTIIVVSFGNRLDYALFEVSSLLGNSGLSIGILTEPNVNSALLWVGSIIMLLGRLEIYAVFFALSKIVVDIKNRIQDKRVVC